MAQSRTQRAQSTAVADRDLSSTQRILRLVLGAIVMVLAAGFAGWVLNSTLRATHQVTVTDTFAGTVSFLDGPGEAGCVTPDGGGKARCSVFVTVPGVAAPRRGEHVLVARETVHSSNGSGYEIFVVYSDKSPPGL